MKRQVVLALVLAVLAGGAPARADHRTSVGRIQAGVWHPEAARILYQRAGPSTNGTVGWVIALSADAKNKVYTLTRTGGLGFENLDAFFYTSINGGACTPPNPPTIQDDATTERGVICPFPGQTPTHAVIVARAGAMVPFRFCYHECG